MTESDLEAAIARTGHERLRWLTSDANPDAYQREAYRGVVERMARDEAPPPDRPLVPLDVALKARTLGFANCPMSEKESDCGCSGLRCRLKGRVVHLGDCVECLGL